MYKLLISIITTLVATFIMSSRLNAVSYPTLGSGINDTITVDDIRYALIRDGSVYSEAFTLIKNSEDSSLYRTVDKKVVSLDAIVKVIANNDSTSKNYPKYKGDICIPDSFEYNGIQYYPAMLTNSLFYINSELTSIRIPIYSGAIFINYCDKLRKVELNSYGRDFFNTFANSENLDTLIIHNYVGFAKTFEDCPNIRTIICHCKPPIIYNDYLNFMGSVKENANLYVPAEYYEEYLTAWEWRRFKNIIPFDNGNTKIEEPAIYRSESYELYNLSGRRLRFSDSKEELTEGLAPGIYIIKCSDGSTWKEYIK